MQTMERLVVDAEGKIVIPLEITQKHGLRPGDEISLVETANGLLVRVNDVEAWAWAQRWWNSLTEEEKRTALQEAEAYESLSEEERDAIWNEFPESIEADAEGDEIDLPTIQRPAR
jgi:bifunctional DNA-binding transcriptional regulator/antitoxin component of YhaV-PrlF toxin-antitoxin module